MIKKKEKKREKKRKKKERHEIWVLHTTI